MGSVCVCVIRLSAGEISTVELLCYSSLPFTTSIQQDAKNYETGSNMSLDKAFRLQNFARSQPNPHSFRLSFCLFHKWTVMMCHSGDSVVPRIMKVLGLFSSGLEQMG